MMTAGTMAMFCAPKSKPSVVGLHVFLENVPSGWTTQGGTSWGFMMYNRIIDGYDPPVHVDWGDGTEEDFHLRPNTHTYVEGGNYEIVFTNAEYVDRESATTYSPIIHGTDQDTTCPYIKSIVWGREFGTIRTELPHMFCQGATNMVSADFSAAVNLTTGGDSMCRNCSSLTSIRLPPNLTKIGTSCFRDCTAITNIDFLAEYQSITYIPMYAFGGCTGLVSAIIPNQFHTTGTYAFQNCTGLKTIWFPSNFTLIGLRSFRDSASVEKIVSENPTPPSVLANAFQNVPKTAAVYVPSASIDAYKAANGWSAFTNYFPLESL